MSQKGLRCQWKPDDLNKATAEKNDGVFTVRATSRAYGIPRTTLQQYVNAKTRKRQLSSEHVVGHTGRYPPLGAQFEKELSDHAKRLSELFFGITKEQLHKLAYEVAYQNGLRHPDKRAAGDDWFYGFMSRNPTLALSKPESTSITRVMGFRRSEVNRFFDNLKEKNENFNPSQIFNADEAGMSTVQVQKQKITAETGKKQIGKIVSAEKDHSSRVLALAVVLCRRIY